VPLKEHSDIVPQSITRLQGLRSLEPIEESTMTDESKRETLALLGAGAAGVMIAGMAGAQNVATPTPEVRGSMAGGREPKPLPFDAAKLNGLSEK
jgi:hypothetical protein